MHMLVMLLCFIERLTDKSVLTCPYFDGLEFQNYTKVRKKANIRNRYNQVRHLTGYTLRENT